MKDIAVITPAHQAEATLADCLEAILAEGVAHRQVLVVDDGSSDGTGRVAREAGVRVLRNERAVRPARARNAGVAAVEAQIVVFVDADVVLNRGALPRLLAAFDDSTVGSIVGAVIGSYDDRPPGASLVSRYRNLMHHHVHQTAPREAETFWSGFGAVRRERFIAAGRFDPDWENIEDVEFGLRLRALGDRIVLAREAQATHLKVWTLRSMMRTDLWGRAVPWTRLLIAGRMPPGALNGGWRHRVSARSVALFGLGLIFWPLFAPAAFAAGLGAGLFLIANAGFLRALGRIAGPAFAVAAIPAHALHYVAAGLGYGYARLHPERRAAPSDAAPSDADQGG